MTEEKKVVTREEVKKHNTAEDCWIVIHGKVYDVTKYLDDHPGGPEIITDNAGGDATDEFEDTGHSPEARETLKKYYIGEVEGGAETKPEAASKSKEDGPSLFLILAILVALLAGAYVMYEPSAAPETK